MRLPAWLKGWMDARKQLGLLSLFTSEGMCSMTTLGQGQTALEALCCLMEVGGSQAVLVMLHIACIE
jgi:hypothetical protein